MLSVTELKVFLPAKDFSRSRSFYQQLGFTENWANNDLSEMQFGDVKFLLQDFYEEQLAQNLMLQLIIKDADAWSASIENSGLLLNFPEVKVRPPEVQPWGQRVMYLWDPSGVLWHFAEEQT